MRTFDCLRQKLRGAARSVTMWVNGILVVVFPFTEMILDAVRDQLPAMQPYLPSNIYQYVGIVVVIFNMYQRTQTTKSLAEKGQK